MTRVSDTLNPELIGQFIDACVQDHDRARRMLAMYPQLLNARWLHGETALHFLSVEGFVEGVRFLAGCGADVNAVNNFGDPPLIDVARLGNSEIAAILLQHGANPNAQSMTANNPLDCAIRAKNAALVSMLLDAGADACYVTDIGESVFDALPASGIKRTQILEVLARHGIVPGAKE
jgi:ankyrin repeat protein